MAKKKSAYTKEQEAAIAWLHELARLNRITEAAIMLARYKPEVWEEATASMKELQATAAAGPAGVSPETAIAIRWSKDDGLINAIRDDGQPVEVEAENWRAALWEFAPALPAGGWGDLMMAAWARIDWAKVVEAGRGDNSGR